MRSVVAPVSEQELRQQDAQVISCLPLPSQTSLTAARARACACRVEGAYITSQIAMVTRYTDQNVTSVVKTTPLLLSRKRGRSLYRLSVIPVARSGGTRTRVR